MATTDARKHTVPVGGDTPDAVAALAALSASIRDIVQVDNTTARVALVTALTDAGIAPSATNPLYVHRTDAAPGRELERTIDGTTWDTLVSSAGGNLATASGSLAWGSVDPGAVRSTPITFPVGRFTAAPAVVAGVGSTRLTVAVVSVTATGCTLQTQNVTTTASAVTTASWVAVEVG